MTGAPAAGQQKGKPSLEPSRLLLRALTHTPTHTCSITGVQLRAGFPAPPESPMNSAFREIDFHWRTGASLVYIALRHTPTNLRTKCH